MLDQISKVTTACMVCHAMMMTMKISIVQSVVHTFSLRLHNHLHTGNTLCYRKHSAPLAWHFDQ